MRIWVKIEHSETQLQFRTSADSDEQLSCGSKSLAKVNGTRMSLGTGGFLHEVTKKRFSMDQCGIGLSLK